MNSCAVKVLDLRLEGKAGGGQNKYVRRMASYVALALAWPVEYITMKVDPGQGWSLPIGVERELRFSSSIQTMAS